MFEEEWLLRFFVAVDIVKEESLSFVPADVAGLRKDEFNNDFGKEEARSLFVTEELRNDEIEETGP